MQFDELHSFLFIVFSHSSPTVKRICSTYVYFLLNFHLLYNPIAGVDMAKTNLAFRGHLLKRPPVEMKNSFSGQPGVYDMASLGIWQKTWCIKCQSVQALARAFDSAVGPFSRQTQLPMGQESVPTH